VYERVDRVLRDPERELRLGQVLSRGFDPCFSLLSHRFIRGRIDRADAEPGRLLREDAMQLGLDSVRRDSGLDGRANGLRR
jgi:hypothetical protein